jgi:hypothetical protein
MGLALSDPSRVSLGCFITLLHLLGEYAKIWKEAVVAYLKVLRKII